jgi:hypothetical protein
MAPRKSGTKPQKGPEIFSVSDMPMSSPSPSTVMEVITTDSHSSTPTQWVAADAVRQLLTQEMEHWLRAMHETLTTMFDERVAEAVLDDIRERILVVERPQDAK